MSTTTQTPADAAALTNPILEQGRADAPRWRALAEAAVTDALATGGHGEALVLCTDLAKPSMAPEQAADLLKVLRDVLQGSVVTLGALAVEMASLYEGEPVKTVEARWDAARKALASCWRAYFAATYAVQLEREGQLRALLTELGAPAAMLEAA